MSVWRLRITLSGLLMLISTAVLAKTYSGPVYDLSWHSIDGGGGLSTGGGYELTGTIGQPDAGEMTGGGYFLHGGFIALPPAEACPADTDGDGMVNVPDLLAMLNAWGLCATPCPSDINGDGFVNVPDLLLLLNAWGACP